MSIYINFLCLILSMAFGLNIIDAIAGHISLGGFEQWSYVVCGALCLVDILGMRTETPFFASFVAGCLIVMVIANHCETFNKIHNQRKRITAKIINDASKRYIKANLMHQTKQEDDHK